MGRRGSGERPIALLSKLFGKDKGASAPELYLGAFGKHPGWNDHIDDIGLETQRLVDFKTFMYVEGISACIDSGRWDKLEPDAQIEGFGHVFMMRARGDVILGRMWSSSDGKGRTKYPMVVLAQCTGASLEWCVANILPELKSVQQRCEAAGTAQEVVSVLDSARANLRGKVQSFAPGQPDLVIPASFMQDLSRRAELGPDAQGLHRILYQMNREVGDYLIGVQPASRFGRTEPTAACHMRVPKLRVEGADREAPGDALLTWARVMLSKLESWTPLLLIVPLVRSYVDVLVGEPQGAQLLCLRAAEKAIPLSTEIPYTIDGQFLGETAAWMNAQAAAGDAAIQPPPTSVLKKLGASGSRFRHHGMAWAMAMAALGAVGDRVMAQEKVPAPAAPAAEFAEPRVRYNNALEALAIKLKDASDAQARAAVTGFLDEVHALPGGIAYMAEVQPLLKKMRAAIDGQAAGPMDALDLSKLGPGVTGLYRGEQEGELLRFRPVAGLALPELVFAKVVLSQSESATKVAYIQTTEVSVTMFAQILATAGAGQDVSKILTKFDRIKDPRVGPRTWEWGSRDVIVSAGSWLPRVGPEAYAPELKVTTPTGESPMQFLSPAASVFIARLVGCRLPSSGEWSAAVAATSVGEGDCNLLDQSWALQAAHDQQRPGGVSGGQLSAFQRGDAPIETKDSWLWFSPVQVGCGGAWKNLVGNVAEYVIDAEGGEQVGAKVGLVDEYVQKHSAEVRVVGGSAFTVNAGTPQKVDLFLAGEGYSDVGFRLAFGASVARPATVNAQLRRLIDPLPLLRVR